MKVAVVSYEDPDAWICGKIARKLTEAARALGCECELRRHPDPSADINHHVIYLSYRGIATGVHTLMVTHVDDSIKLHRLQSGLGTAKAGICMSAETCNRLASLGISQRALTYAHLPHDGQAREKRFYVAITTRLYPDGRKRERDFVRLLEHISPSDFAFRIMGFGWKDIVQAARLSGFEIEYYENFDSMVYLELLARSDYFLYLGEDEGSAAFIDALAAGIKTIVRPQGFHLDPANGISHPFNTFNELRGIFQAVADEKHRLINSVRDWTWNSYAQCHLAIWRQCLAGLPLSDGVPAWMLASPTPSFGLRLKLHRNAFLHRAKMLLNLKRDFECGSRLWQKRPKTPVSPP